MTRRGAKGDDYAELDVRVRYAETDSMGVVYHANYLVWFEMGRSEYCRKQGFNYRDLEASGYYIIVAEARCRYRKPARYDEVITVRTSLHALQRRSICFRYQVLRKGSRETLVEGETKHLCIDAAGRAKVIPEPYFTYLAQGLPIRDSHG
ncbi:MAG: acyl-CoA thioesterase [Desulfobacterales bacterium]|nr:acyl-CoA thioesterase [Desulfobacterales bacterium]